MENWSLMREHPTSNPSSQIKRGLTSSDISVAIVANHSVQLHVDFGRQTISLVDV